MHEDDTIKHGQLKVIERTKAKRPSLYKVILFNDDYTPREFVVMILEQFFSMNDAQASAVMLTAHTQGQAVCGIFPFEIAETKVKSIEEFVKGYELPLRFGVDQA